MYKNLIQPGGVEVGDVCEFKARLGYNSQSQAPKLQGNPVSKTNEQTKEFNTNKTATEQQQ